MNEATISEAGESNRGMRRSCSIRECRLPKKETDEKRNYLSAAVELDRSTEKRLCDQLYDLASIYDLDRCFSLRSTCSR